MPELPEVETTRRGLEPHLVGRRIERLCLREPRLRWPVPETLPEELPGQRIQGLDRRGKYLIAHLDQGDLIIHLGMSGSLRVVEPVVPAGRHDHWDLELSDGWVCRYRDPRRFGSLLWTDGPAMRHPRLRDLGPEPLDPAFDGDYLYTASRGRRLAVKAWLMDSHIVVGVGNIYANEALFRAGIHPARAAGRISRTRYMGLAQAIRATLGEAIDQGGTSLRDFVHEDGKPGYFRQSLSVYERAGCPCPRCGRSLQRRLIAQRATYLCVHCQR